MARPPPMAELELEIWEGVVPIVVTLEPSEVTTLDPPAPYFAVVPRITYLSAVCTAIVEHFAASAPMGGGLENVWFDHAGTAMLGLGLSRAGPAPFG